MRITLFITMLLGLFLSCSREKQNFKIELRLPDTDGGMVYVARRTLTGTAVIDSALPDKSGSYLLEGYAPQPDFYIVYQNTRQYINLIVKPGDDFRILTNAASFDVHYLIEGSKDSRLIQKMVNMQTRTLEKITEISTRYENSIGNRDFGRIKPEIDSIYEVTVSEHKQFSISLIRENPGSLVTLMALYQQLGRNAPVFDYKTDFMYYEMVDSSLASLYPNVEAVIDLNRKVTELRDLLRLDIGAPAPEIALPDTAQQLVALSSLRNQYVVLVFWASWSSRSVSVIQELAEHYTKSARNNVSFYHVSLDRTRESWLDGLSRIPVNGVHVSDLKYWDSPVVSRYHIEQLPVIFLLDKEGKILKKDIQIDELHTTLKGL